MIDVLGRTHNIITIVGGLLVILVTVSAYAATKANQADLDALQESHTKDIIEVKRDINQQAVEAYTDQIHILESNPNASAHDRSTANYLKGRQADLRLKMAQ